MNSPFQLQIDFTNDYNWIFAFIVKLKIRSHIRLHRRNSKNPNNLHKNSLFSNKQWNRDGKLQMTLQKTIFVFRQAYVQATCLTGHKILVIWAFILIIMTSHSLLLQPGHSGLDFSGHGWFPRLSLALPSRGEQSIAIIVCTNQSFCYNNFEI